MDNEDVTVLMIWNGILSCIISPLCRLLLIVSTYRTWSFPQMATPTSDKIFKAKAGYGIMCLSVLKRKFSNFVLRLS